MGCCLICLLDWGIQFNEGEAARLERRVGFGGEIVGRVETNAARTVATVLVGDRGQARLCLGKEQSSPQWWEGAVLHRLHLVVIQGVGRNKRLRLNQNTGVIRVNVIRVGRVSRGHWMSRLAKVRRVVVVVGKGRILDRGRLLLILLKVCGRQGCLSPTVIVDITAVVVVALGKLSIILIHTVVKARTMMEFRGIPGLGRDILIGLHGPASDFGRAL